MVARMECLNLLLFTVIFSISQANVTRLNATELAYQDFQTVYSWVSVNYEWLNSSMEMDYRSNEKFVPNLNVPSGIKVYGGEVYVSVSRWFSGVPSTLNQVVSGPTGTAILRPFPDWDSQTIGNCKAFQFVQAMEIDPNTGYMWIVDTGRSGIFNPKVTKNSCPAKIVIYDLKMKKEVHRYTFPNNVVNGTTNYLNDIVLDYVNREVAFAYITDTGSPGLVVYDFKNDNSYRFEDSRMSSESDKPINIDGIPFDPKVPINGIAMSADFKYVYFSAVSGVTLYQIPTSALRNKTSDMSQAIRKVGIKPSQGDGMVYAKENLYFGGLNDSSVYRWKVREDVKKDPSISEGNVSLTSVEKILWNKTALGWVDTLAIDEAGFLWLTSANVGKFFQGRLNFTENASPNFRIINSYIKEKSYLSGANLTPTIHSNSHRLAPQTIGILSSAIFLTVICQLLH